MAGTTPTLTIGDGGAEDTKIVFDGNAQNFYIGLDDSADDLLIGLGSTVGTTPAIAIDENNQVTLPDGHMVINSTAAGDNLTLISTNAGAEAGPQLVLYRNSASPANNDVIGRMRFEGEDNEGNKTVYAQLTSQIIDKGSSGGEDSTFQMEVFNNGALRDIMIVKGATNGLPEVVFNDASQDVNFRIEADGSEAMFFIDGGGNHINVGTYTDLGGTFNVLGTAVIQTSDSTAGPNGDADELFIESNGNAGLTIGSSTSASGNIHFADVHAANRGILTYDHSADQMKFGVAGSIRARFTSSGEFLAGKSSSGIANSGVELHTDKLSATVSNATVMYLNRLLGDGTIAQFHQAGTEEGSIEVNGSTVSYNGFTGSHWSRLADNSKPSILRGTIMDSIDEMCDWYQAVAEVPEVLWTAEDPETQDTLWTEDNTLPEGVEVGDIRWAATQTVGDIKEEAYTIKESITLGDKSVGDSITFTSNTKTGDGKEYTGTIVKEDDVKHTKSKVSDTADSKKVYGVFSHWDDADDGLDGDVNDMNIAQVGTYVIRINADVTVEAGDLLVSNGDGTAKVQDDDIIRSKTVAKVNSSIKIETYADGSYTVPCTLHC